jgi:wyosine [tRNA(Phe)-imidazoG37] synthetase (radical SAM superfamily)
MTDARHRIAFGPVPSRRLGRSLGVNNIPPKVCSYACVYCQVGRTRESRCERREFYPVSEVIAAVTDRLRQAKRAGEPVDYLTLVADGEPTLDARLGEALDALRAFGRPLAVITNATLLWREDVRRELARADWVSVKVDAVDETVWRRVNRPHKHLELARMLEGTLEFARGFDGTLVSETMLLAGHEGTPAQIEALATYLERLAPACAYLAVPTRPPARAGVMPPSPASLNRCYQILTARLPAVELLIGYEGNSFASTGDAREDLLSITAVHPLREDAALALLARTGAGPRLLGRLVDEGLLVEAVHGGRRFYLRAPAGAAGA